MTPSDRIGNQPRQIDRPMSRQAFRPGQWDGVKLGSSHKTYIQNNFYGPQTNYRGWGDAWAGYEYKEPCYEQEQKPNWLSWVGIGTGVLGGILNAFGVGQKQETPEVSERGAVPETATPPLVPETTQTTRQETTAPVTPKTPERAPKKEETATPPTTTPVTTQEPETEPEAEQDPTVDNFNWESGFSTYAMDEAVNGKSPTEEISGKISVKEKGEAGKAPKKFTLTDGNNTYSFEKIENANGSVSYKCTGCTGGKTKTYTQGNVYECRLVNGKPVLIQPKDEEGWGKGLDRSNQ